MTIPEYERFRCLVYSPELALTPNQQSQLIAFFTAPRVKLGRPPIDRGPFVGTIDGKRIQADRRYILLHPIAGLVFAHSVLARVEERKTSETTVYEWVVNGWRKRQNMS